MLPGLARPPPRLRTSEWLVEFNLAHAISTIGDLRRPCGKLGMR